MLWLVLFLSALGALFSATDNHVSFRAHGGGQGVYLRIHVNLAGGLWQKEYVFCYDFREKKGKNTLWKFFKREKKAEKESFYDLTPLFARCRVKTNFYLALGTGDAPATALVWPFLQALVFALGQYWLSQFPQQSQRILFRPVFTRPAFLLDANCMISIKTGKLIVAALQIAVHTLWEAGKTWCRASILSCRPQWKTFYK